MKYWYFVLAWSALYSSIFCGIFWSQDHSRLFGFLLAVLNIGLLPHWIKEYVLECIKEEAKNQWILLVK